MLILGLSLSCITSRTLTFSYNQVVCKFIFLISKVHGFVAFQERFYFGDNVLPCFESGIPLLKHRLHQLPDSNNITIAFPDEGAWKRFYKQLQHFPMVFHYF